MPVLKIKNISTGPRGFWSTRGLRVLDPGQEAEADVADHEAASLASNGEFAVAGGADAVSPIVRAASSDAVAAALAIKDGPFLAFKSAATKILGPDAPTTKAELIAALQAKAAS